MNRKSLKLVSLCLAALLLPVLTISGCAKPAPAPAPKPAFKMPEPLVCATLDVGGGGYVMTAAVN